MKTSSLFRLAATVILIQIALGGLVTFDFIPPVAHIVWGIVVVAVAIAATMTSLRSHSVDKQLRSVSLGMMAALAFQVVLGFTTLALSSDALAWVHLVLGVIIYAMALTGMSFAQRQEYLSAGIHPIGVP